MPTTLEFLKAILPERGKYCLVVIDSKGPKQEFYETTEALEQRIKFWDSRTDGAVYHGCASYDGRGRRHDNVESIRSLWLDIDADPAVAIDGLGQFVGTLCLPHPIVVCSGRGIHAYWPLTSGVERPVWERYARGLKQACDAHGLKADPSRTADAASILRPPGTWNRKREPIEVTCGPLEGPYELAKFDILVNHTDHFAVRHNFVNTHPRNGHQVSNLLRKLLNVHTPEHISFELLTRNCAQLRRFEETNGVIPEPSWYASLGVLAWCDGGDEIAHQWSNGHPTYTREETQRRLDRNRRLDGPTTCKKLKELNGALCYGCKGEFTYTTPLDAARDAPKPRDEAIYTTLTEHTTPENFVVRNNGLFFLTEGKDGRDAPIKLSSFPVYLTRSYLGEVLTTQSYHHIVYEHPNDGAKDVVFKSDDLVGPAMSAKMAAKGITIHDNALFAKYIRDSADITAKREKTGMLFEQFGWKDKGTKFLYGPTLYGSNDYDERPALSEDLKGKARFLVPVPGGSLGAWKDAMDNMMGKGSEGMSFICLAAFGSVLMPFLDRTEGGAVIQLVTPDSGRGKSTALSGALSVWSGDKRGLELTTVDTRTSKMVAMSLLCNLPGIYDEFQNKDPAIVREFMETYMIGRDRMRSDIHGHLVTHSAATWTNFMLAAGNKSLSDTIRADGDTDAPAMRIMELPVESSGDMKQSELIRRAEVLSANAGWAGDAYLRYLLHPEVLPWVRENLMVAIDDIMAQAGFRREHRFWARALAATQIAALLIEKAGIITFSSGRIMDWAIGYFAGQVGEKHNITLLPVLSQYINEHQGELLHMPCEVRGNRLEAPIGELPKHRVNIRIEQDSQMAWLAVKPLRKWLERNAQGNFTFLMTELKEAGVLEMERTLKTLTAGSGMPGGQIECCKIDLGHPAMSGVLRDANEATRKDRLLHRLAKL